MISIQRKPLELPALRDNDQDYEVIEKKIKQLLRSELYLPLVRMIGEKSNKLLKNSKDDLLNAIKSGQIEYHRGSFNGRFNAQISKELRALGASWDRGTRTWKLSQSSLPLEVRNAISASGSYFQAKVFKIDRHLANLVPAEIADKLSLSKHFDNTLYKVNKEFGDSVRNVVVPPQMTTERVERLSKEWSENMHLWIKNWTEEAITDLRKDVQASVFAGNRNETVRKMIQKSYGESVNKAKFLARQETRLLLTKFKQTRYEEAGVNEYKWGIANRAIQPKNGKYVKGMVRHDHGVLAGKIFRWDNPPVTDTETGARNNPGQDYNCRCFAIPIMKFKKG